MINLEKLNLQQKAAINLIQNDLRFIYTIIVNRANIKSNYIVFAMPLIGTIIDGAEDWLKAYNNSSKNKIDIPLFTKEEQEYYENMRSSIKFWDSPYSTINENLKQLYSDSDKYFSSLCKPIARILKLYYIFGADLADNQFCGNTILCNSYVPNFSYGTNNGEQIKQLSEIGGKYIALFGATTPYKINTSINFSYSDYGGLNKSPIGNEYSNKFIIFCLLCQVNFILICVEKYISEECSTKLRFAYLQYFYISKILPEMNSALNSDFKMDTVWVSEQFRNAMAHYKIGIALKPKEIIQEDYFMGLTQKYFSCDYHTLKKNIMFNLSSIANQMKIYLDI